jgi:hypothetical protein
MGQGLFFIGPGKEVSGSSTSGEAVTVAVKSDGHGKTSTWPKEGSVNGVGKIRVMVRYRTSKTCSYVATISTNYCVVT